MATISTVLADHLCCGLLPESIISTMLVKLVAILGITTMNLINYSNNRAGLNTANIFFILKLTIVFSVPLSGVCTSLLGHGAGVSGGTGHG